MLAEQFHDPHFWVLLSTILFAVVAWKKGKKPLLALLDARTNRIRSELEEAERLRAEAQAFLVDIQRKHRDAIQTAQKIIDTARETAGILHKEAEGQLAESLARREKQLLGRIERAEAAAVQELRTQAADIASRSGGRVE